MSKLIVQDGNRSSHGGTVSTSATKTSAEGVLVLLDQDMHSCPLPAHGVTPVTSSAQKTIVENKKIILNGDLAGCGAAVIAGTVKSLAG